MQRQEFLTRPLIFYRSYSRIVNGLRESWDDVCDRTLSGLKAIGNLTDEQAALIDRLQREYKTITSGRFLWVGGTKWLEDPDNVYGSYNCSNTIIDSIHAIALQMSLSMTGCGVGAILEEKFISKIPKVTAKLDVSVSPMSVNWIRGRRLEKTETTVNQSFAIVITVGDSRQGWVDAYEQFMALAVSGIEGTLKVEVDLTYIRPKGEAINGFGGVANASKLPQLWGRLADILNGAIGRNLNAEEVCLLIDEGMIVVVAGNVRRSAGLRQFDVWGKLLKTNLWSQDTNGNWVIDPKKDALRMSNHTRVYHKKPSRDECIEAVRSQYFSGEGAIQWAGEAVARANADILEPYRKMFLFLYDQDVAKAKAYLKDFMRLDPQMTGKSQEECDKELDDRMERYGLNPCLTGDTLVRVRTATGEGAVQIQNLVGKAVSIFDGERWAEVDNFRVTGHNQDVWKVTLSNNDSIKATISHTFILADGTRKPLGVLTVGDRLKSIYPSISPEVISVEYYGNVSEVYCCTVPTTSSFALANGILTGNCGEIIPTNNFCNLGEVHLNMLDPNNLDEQDESFYAAGVGVAVLLHHKFPEARYQYSREVDPIVGVSFTGLFDFFVNRFGVDWLRWWEAGRPDEWGDAVDFDFDPSYTYLSSYYKNIEESYLTEWKESAFRGVYDYCDRNGLRRPNRCTTVQPSGCLTKDALRVFDDGLYYADEHLQEATGDCDVSEYGLSVRNGITVTNAIANPERETLKITLRNGRELTMTLDHRLSVGGEWVKAQDLRTGDILDVELGNYINAREAHLDYVSVEYGLTGRQPQGCLLPSEMSPALAYFIGALFGNGCMSEKNYRIRFSHGNINILRHLSFLSSQLFGLKGTLAEDSRGGKYELCLANKQLYLWFAGNGIGKDCCSKSLNRIPLKIRQSSRESVLAFFSGMIDTDGCIRKGGKMSIDSASEPFMRSLQQIGEAVGLCFSLYANTEGDNWQQGQKNMFGLSISRMKSSADAITVLNRYSVKAVSRPITTASRDFKFEPYEIESIKSAGYNATYDYSVNADTDNDSWYWQGAIKSHNSKSLLTNASPGWHPPKASRYIRRMTFARDHSIASAAIAYGYSVIPSQSDKDENGQLLDDPFDPRCTEWLVEVPIETSWANLEGAADIDISKFSALAQFDFYMQVQKHYVSHNCSGTLEVRESEIELLGDRIYQAIRDDEGYVSCAILARYDDLQTFPRLPFEPIDKATYDRLVQEVEERRTVESFAEALQIIDNTQSDSAKKKEASEAGPAGCDSDKCLFPNAVVSG